MPNRLFSCVALLLIGLSPLAGCARAVQADNPATIGAQDYEAAFAASVEVLRDHGFRIARNDYRFGVISTYPKESPTLAEPWVGDNTSDDQALRGTLNAERRVVTVTFEPTLDYAAYLNSEAFLRDFENAEQNPDGTRSVDANDNAYLLTIEVQVQRRREPSRYLTHSANGYISAQYAAVPTHLRQRGIEGDSWETIKRDELFEQRLSAAVLGALAGPKTRPAESDTGRATE